MSWVLEIFVGGQHARRLTLDLPEIFIGRSPSNHIHLPHVACSRKHVRLAVTSGHVILEDLGSTNGVYVNGQKMNRGLLGDRDRFTVGPYTFLLSNIEHPEDVPSVSKSATRDEQTGRHTVFIDEEVKRKFVEHSNPLEDTHSGV
ncbi:MAG TPA: FHA domain-containing protein [Thermoanaerobaculia bacterium]|nr:FHA domain-containing protein [Thermoanaerobaculia bacterium]HUM29947.1 FHA domain-containing protein [Thermoanaerobaculia bacterium]HXK68186.1 FHA domain-containing protein [Thermoanaerobaculia bacterium]